MRNSREMVCYNNGKIAACSLKKVVGRLKYVDVKTMYDVERYDGRRTIIGREEQDVPSP